MAAARRSSVRRFSTLACGAPPLQVAAGRQRTLAEVPRPTGSSANRT